MDMTPPYQLLILPSCYLLRWVVVIQHRPKKITHICVFFNWSSNLHEEKAKQPPDIQETKYFIVIFMLKKVCSLPPSYYSSMPVQAQTLSYYYYIKAVRFFFSIAKKN